MSSREPFEKCLGTVVRLMPKELEGAVLLENIPIFGRPGSQFLYQGGVYLLGFSEGFDFLSPQIFKYEDTSKRSVHSKEAVYSEFCGAYKRALFKFLKQVIEVGNTEYLCETYATYLLSHYKEVVNT